MGIGGPGGVQRLGPHLAKVCRMERLVARRGKTSREVAYAVTSLAPEQTSPQRLLALWRGQSQHVQPLTRVG